MLLLAILLVNRFGMPIPRIKRRCILNSGRRLLEEQPGWLQSGSVLAGVMGEVLFIYIFYCNFIGSNVVFLSFLAHLCHCDHRMSVICPMSVNSFL